MRIHVSSRSGRPFWRAGLEFGKAPRLVDEEQVGPATIAAIRAEPALVVAAAPTRIDKAVAQARAGQLDDAVATAIGLQPAPDQDGDGIPDPLDRDQDGDGKHESRPKAAGRRKPKAAAK